MLRNLRFAVTGTIDMWINIVIRKSNTFAKRSHRHYFHNAAIAAIRNDVTEYSSYNIPSKPVKSSKFSKFSKFSKESKSSKSSKDSSILSPRRKGARRNSQDAVATTRHDSKHDSRREKTWRHQEREKHKTKKRRQRLLEEQPIHSESTRRWSLPRKHRPFSLFASCLPGLEPLLLREIQCVQDAIDGAVMPLIDNMSDMTSNKVPTEISNETSNEISNRAANQTSIRGSNKGPSKMEARAVSGGVELTVPNLAHLYLLHLYLGTPSHIYWRLTHDETNDNNNDINSNMKSNMNNDNKAITNGSATNTGGIRARGFPELERKIKRLIHSQQWGDQWWHESSSSRQTSALHNRVRLQVHAVTSKSKLMHTKAIEERVTKAVVDSLPNVTFLNDPQESDLNNSDVTSSKPDQRQSTNNSDNHHDKMTFSSTIPPNSSDDMIPILRVLVRVERDIVQLSIDTSSSTSPSANKPTPMHKRGYRLESTKAPLREDLAYALLLGSGILPCWDLSPSRELLFFSNCNIDEDQNQHKNNVTSEHYRFQNILNDTQTPSACDNKRRIESTSDEGDHNVNEWDISGPDQHLQSTQSKNASTLRLLDPLCGSGTIAIEGAAILARLPPGRFRKAPLFGTKLYDPILWQQLLKGAIKMSNTSNDITPFRVAANDRDRGAIKAAKANAHRAGVYPLIEFTCGSFTSHPWLVPRSLPSSSLLKCDDSIDTDADADMALSNNTSSLCVITNAPYGKRLSSSHKTTEKPLLPLYQKLGHVLQSSSSRNLLLQYAMIGNNLQLLRQTGLSPLNVIFSTKHGGLNVMAVVGKKDHQVIKTY